MARLEMLKVIELAIELDEYLEIFPAIKVLLRDGTPVCCD